MSPLQTLTAEHAQLKRVVALLFAEACRINEGARADLPRLEALVDFLDAYLLGGHQLRETILFEAMFAAGSSRVDSPPAVRVHEQAAERAYIARLRGALAAIRGGDRLAEEELAAAAGDYADLAILHMSREEAAVYGRAPDLLGAFALAQVGVRLGPTPNGLAEMTKAAAALEAAGARASSDGRQT